MRHTQKYKIVIRSEQHLKEVITRLLKHNFLIGNGRIKSLESFIGSFIPKEIFLNYHDECNRIIYWGVGRSDDALSITIDEFFDKYFKYF